MIGDIFATVLLPIILPMEMIFDALWAFVGSAGVSIITLALIVSLLTIPLKKWAGKVEDEFFAFKQSVDTEVAEKTLGLKGEKRFTIVEAIYEKHGYHPIKSIISGASFIVILPFLISAIFIFGNADSLTDVSFLLVDDLSAQDQLLLGINLLPILMLVLGVGDAMLRWRNQRDQLVRYLVISLILIVLVYTLSSALILYWISMNFWSFLIFFLTSRVSIKSI